MRPLPGDEAYAARSRSGSLGDNDATPLAARAHQPQMSYFLADEKTMEAGQAQSPNRPRGREVKNSTFGVQSMESSSTSQASMGDAKVQSTLKKKLAQHLAGTRDTSPESTNDSSEQSSPFHQRPSSQATISRPYTPISLGSPAPPSFLSSPHSGRDSDDGSDMCERGSQAIVSSGEDEQPHNMVGSGSSPQLVMPSIQMPSRRSFTEKGKAMGRLKVLIAGDRGAGKTSLIMAIFQVCEDIVHLDPITASSTSHSEIQRHSKTNNAPSAQLKPQITEVFASTRAYPAWWSDIEDSRMLRRRKSLGDSVLERNLCFVDTPGYDVRSSASDSIDPIMNYIETQVRKVLSIDGLRDSDLVNMLGGNGGSQVDVVFYLIKHPLKFIDFAFLRRLAPLTNIIPLISHSDTMTAEQITDFKTQVMSELQSIDVRPFVFGPSSVTASQAPYAISTQPSKDDETMDASLLMSPDYVCPLIPSELSILVSQVFERDTISWLRYSAAKKFIQWRDTNDLVSKPQSLYRPLSASASQALTTPVGATTSFAMARITDHTQREERLAQIRLSKWAADLQRSLQNERARFESLARSERAIWLTERLGECVQDGTIIPISQARPDNRPSSLSEIIYRHHSRPSYTDTRDPLGILAWKANMKRHAKVAIRVLTGMGIFAGFFLLFRESEVGREVVREMRGVRDRCFDLNAVGWRFVVG